MFLNRVLFALALLAIGCSSTSKDPSNDEDGPSTQATKGPSTQELSEHILKLNQRLDTLDEKIAQVNDKLNAAQISFENLSGVQKPKNTPVIPHPMQQTGVNPLPEEPENSKATFTQNEATEKFRSALILFEGGKWPEAILGFNSFLKNYSDHPLAGSAQYHIGEAYFKQGEYKLAIEEFQHVLVSYDQSSHVPDALKRLVEAEEKLKLTKAAARHKQLLLSLFPQSPAAKDILEGKETITSQSHQKIDAQQKTSKTDISVVPTAPVPQTTGDSDLSKQEEKH